MANVREIVAGHLREQGYDGLYSTSISSCACLLDDLMPCAGWSGSSDRCEPGYRVPCDGECEFAGACEYHVVPERPKERPYRCVQCGHEGALKGNAKRCSECGAVVSYEARKAMAEVSDGE